jgi:hypothetical protein
MCWKQLFGVGEPGPSGRIWNESERNAIALKFPRQSKAERDKVCETPKTFQGGDLQVVDHRGHRGSRSTLISPPDSLNSGKNPSQTDLPSGHLASVNVKPPLTLACSAICESHLSTSTHASSKGCSMYFQAYSIAIDVNAGAEPIEHRMFVR